MSLDEEGQGSVHFFQGSPGRCASFKFFPDTDIANHSGLTATEVGFLVVKTPSLPVAQIGDRPGMLPCYNGKAGKLKHEKAWRKSKGVSLSPGKLV